MIATAPRSHITGVPGWESHDEQELLLRLAQAVPDKGVIVELGAEFGMSTSLFCHGARDSVDISSIDLFPRDILQVHHRNLRAVFPDRQMRQVPGDSSTIGASWAENTTLCPIDLLFIDADHSYAGVKADIEAWTPHVRIGGRVAFHDCIYATNFHADHLYQFDVTRAVAEWFTRHARSWRTYEYVDSIMSFERTA